MITIIPESRMFLSLSKKLKSNGYKKKEIASLLEMHAPVYSSLVKTVIPQIAEIEDDIPEQIQEEKIKLAFAMTNNLSQTKICSKLAFYNNRLNEFISETKKPMEYQSYLSCLKKQAEFSYDFIKQYYQGIYHFYYVSSDKYCIKRDPFLIKPNKIEKHIEVFKGNTKCNLVYNGIGTLVNMHTLSFHMVEMHENPEEYLTLLLSLPFIRKPEHLRGIFMNVNYARQPIARKVVLHKISDHVDMDEFNKQDFVYYQDPSEISIKEIADYLLAPDAKTECYMISNPTFEFSDLTKETEFSAACRDL